MNATGNIIYTTYPGVDKPSCRWEGGSVAIASAFGGLTVPTQGGACFDMGELKLRVIHIDLMRDYTYVIQRWTAIGNLVYLRHQVAATLNKVYYRSILTMQVWKCAKVPPGCIPGWQDLHLPRRKPK